MIHRSAAIVGILLVALVDLGCRGPAAVGASATATVPSATGSAVGSTSPSPPSLDTGATPPDARLSVEGGDPVTGQLGSYTWAGGGSDSPWLPGTPLKAAAGEPLTITLAGGVAVARWTARRVPAGAEGGTGVSGLGSGAAGPVTFAAPTAGAWSVQVTVDFAGDRGSASYYWRLDVS